MLPGVSDRGNLTDDRVQMGPELMCLDVAVDVSDFVVSFYQWRFRRSAVLVFVPDY